MKDITIIVPTYNEEDSVGQVLDDLKRVMKVNGIEGEIIVVDDGSRDGTVEEVKRREVRLIRHEENRGYGASLKTGIKEAGGDTILITDADGTYPCDSILQLLKFGDGYDMVVGERRGREIPLLRRPAKWLLNRLASYLVERRIPDLNSGFRLLRKGVVMRFFEILPERFSFTATITLAMVSYGYRVKYVPIKYLKRTGRSKIRPLQDTGNFLLLIIRTVIYFNPLKVFLPLSLLLFLFGIFILLYSAFKMGKVMDITSIVVILSSLHIAIFGFIADLIVKRGKFK